MNARRFTLTDINNSTFYQLPKFLFDKEKVSGLDLIAKVLYAVYLDRLNLSVKNKWVNNSGEVYLIFCQSELAELLDCSLPTLRRAIKQLVSANLIEVEEQSGLKRANKIYVNYLDVMEKPAEPEQLIENINQITAEACPEIDTTSPVEDRKPVTIDRKNFTTNKTNHNKTNYYKSINQRKMAKTEKIDMMDIKHAKKKAKKQIHPDMLCDVMKCNKGEVDEITSLIAEVYSTKKNYLRINSENMDTFAVRKRFKALNEEHVSYVLTCMKNTTGEIRNIKSYLLTALYNAPATMDTYYQNLYNRTFGAACKENTQSYNINDFDKLAVNIMA